MEIMIINKIYILRTTTIGSGGSLEDLQNASLQDVKISMLVYS
jgi:hypothetical protein